MEFTEAFPRGRDPFFFAEHIMGVRLNAAQKRWFATACATKNGWEWVFRRSVHVAANQIGKTLGLALAVLWAANYKIGIENNDYDSWLNTEWNWFHLGPTYIQSMLLSNDIQALISGKHPAQFDKDTGTFRPVLFPPELHTVKKIDATYYAIELWNNARIHFRTSAEKAKSLQGVRAHGISFDEAAFEDHLLAVMDQAVKLRLISTGGPLWMVSTPNGMNDYYIVAQEILNNSIEVEERRWENKERRISLVWSHITDNVGYGFSAEDVEFMELDVDEATKEQQLRGAFLNPQDAFFTPPETIEAAFRKIPEEQVPQNGHEYAIFWDVALSSDPTVCIVIDKTNRPYKGVYFRRWVKSMSFRELVSEMERVHWYFSTPQRDVIGRSPTAITGFDASSMGGVAVQQELSIPNMVAMNMSGSSKMKTANLLNTRTYLSTGRLILPKAWVQLKKEMFSYRRDDDKLVQDSVMALTGAVKLIEMSGSGSRRSAPFQPGGRISTRRIVLPEYTR